jgi:hypothetical protein
MEEGSGRYHCGQFAVGQPQERRGGSKLRLDYVKKQGYQNAQVERCWVRGEKGACDIA